MHKTWLDDMLHQSLLNIWTTTDTKPFMFDMCECYLSRRVSIKWTRRTEIELRQPATTFQPHNKVTPQAPRDPFPHVEQRLNGSDY
jgi:hypothetical protein